MGELSIPDMLPSAAIPPSSQRCRMAVKTEARVPALPPSSSSPSSSSSSCPSPSPSSSMGGNEQFPAGMRVLLVDDDRTCLKILSQMLCRCNYQVTPCSKATDALALLRANWGGYDMVISDVYMPDMDGFKLLELVGLEMDLPVIMMSANGDTSVVMKGITHGACDYLLKPVRMEELRNIWQHVIRRRSSANEEKHKHRSGDGHRSPSCEGPDATGSSYRHSKKRKEGMMMAEEDEEDEEHEGEELAGGAKKARVVWSVDLHQQFVNAVNQLGIDKAVPKRILELMNVPGLTRENVASHLQKYRLYLKRISGVSSEAGGGGTNNPPLPPPSTLGDLQALAAAVQLSPQALSSTLIHQLSLPNALGGALTTDPALLLHHLASMQASGSNSSTTTSALPRTLFGQSSGRLPELNPTNNALLMQILQQSHRLPSIGSHVSTKEVGVSGLSQLKSNPLSSSLLSSNPTLSYEVGSNGLPLPLLKPNPPPNLLSSNPTLSYEVGSNGLPQLKSNLLGLNPTSLPFEVGSNGLTQLKPNQSPSNHLGLNPTSLPYELGSNELPQLKPNPPPSNLLSSNPTLPYEVGSNGLPLLKPNPSPSNLLSSNPSLSYEVGSNDLPHLKINSSLTNLIGSNPTLPYEVGSNNLPQLKRNSSLTNLIGSNPTLPYEVGSNDLPQLKRNSSLTNLLGSNLTLPYDVGSNGFSQLKPNPPLSNLLRLNSTLPYEVGSNGLPELKPDPSPNLLGSNPTSLPYASLASSEDESEGGFNPIYSSNMAINGMTKLSQYTSSNLNSSNHPGWQALGLHHNMRQSATTTSPLASPRCHDMGSFGSSVNNDQMQAWATTPFASHNGSSSSNTSTSSTQLKPAFGHIPKQYKQPSIVEAGNESKIEEGSPHLLVGSRTSHGMMSETFSTSEELMMHMLLKQRQDGFSESDFVGGNIGLNNMYVK